MAKEKNKKKKEEDGWTNVRFRKTTVQKLKILKARRDDLMYDDTLQYLLSKENLEFK